jgi:RHS repeat-associated protein
LGSVRAVFNGSKTKIGSSDFSPFGVPEATQLPAGMEARFTVHQFDTDANLFYSLNRYYSPTDARWSKRDPLDMVDGPNTYSYVGGNPVSYIDPLGLCGVDCDKEYGDCVDKCNRAYKRAQDRINKKYIDCLGAVAGLCIGGCVLACAGTGLGFPICYKGCMLACAAAGALACRYIRDESLKTAQKSWQECLRGCELDRERCELDNGT